MHPYHLGYVHPLMLNGYQVFEDHAQSLKLVKRTGFLLMGLVCNICVLSIHSSVVYVADDGLGLLH